MKKIYESKEELAQDVVRKYNVCEGLNFSSVSEKDQLLFDLSLELEGVPLREIQAYGDVANYMNDYFRNHLHLVKKAESVKL